MSVGRFWRLVRFGMVGNGIIPRPWSPSGRTSIGVKCVDGVVLGVEKLLLSRMLAPSSGTRLHTVEDHIGAVRAGREGLSR